MSKWQYTDRDRGIYDGPSEAELEGIREKDAQIAANVAARAAAVAAMPESLTAGGFVYTRRGEEIFEDGRKYYHLHGSESFDQGMADYLADPD